MQKKRALIKMVFDKAKKEVPNGSTSSLAAYLSALFEEKFEFAKGEKTFSRYHKKLIDENADYNIDAITLDQLSTYIGFENYNSFCENYRDEKVQQYGAVKITVSNQVTENNLSDNLSGVIVINITNSPVFNIPEFFTQHKNSFGLVGLLIMVGFFVNRSGYFENNKEIIVAEVRYPVELVTKQNLSAVQQPQIYFVEKPEPETVVEKDTAKEKECMYWNGDYYEAVFCDDKIAGANVIAFDEDECRLLKKITMPDTLTVDNAIGKVWYDKSGNRLEYFTHYGIHPTNGKTLKPISASIIESHVE